MPAAYNDPSFLHEVWGLFAAGMSTTNYDTFTIDFV